MNEKQRVEVKIEMLEKLLSEKVDDSGKSIPAETLAHIAKSLSQLKAQQSTSA